MTNYITIPLSKRGKSEYETIVSPEDKDLAEFNWTVLMLAKNRTFYSYRKENRKISILMHRVIMESMLERKLKKGEWVDHINGDGLDNRRENLRLATPSQNMQNVGKRSHNTSGYKGVSSCGSRWRATIRVNGKQKHLGVFATPELAHAAYCESADKLHGDFANYGEDDR